MNEFEETVCYRFAAFCVKVLRISARRCYEEIGRRNEKEMSLSLLCENALDYLITEKKYFGVSHHFSVNGYLVEIRDDNIGEAIKQLDKIYQDILLLYYFLGFTNKEISEICDCFLRTVIRRKEQALKLMRKALEE